MKTDDAWGFQPVWAFYRSYRLRFLALLLIVTLAAAPLPATSKIIYRWVLPSPQMPKIKKVLVIAVIENYLIRQRFEDEMERLLAESGVEGVKSHMVLPPRNEMMEGELKQRIKESTLDAVLVIRPKDVRKESEDVTFGAYVPPPGYYSFWPYWNTVSSPYYSTPSYTQEKTVVRAEFNLYSARDENLLWSGETDTVYSRDFEKLSKDYAKILVKQLKRDKVIGKK